MFVKFDSKEPPNYLTQSSQLFIVGADMTNVAVLINAAWEEQEQPCDVELKNIGESVYSGLLAWTSRLFPLAGPRGINVVLREVHKAKSIVQTFFMWIRFSNHTAIPK